MPASLIDDMIDDVACGKEETSMISLLGSFLEMRAISLKGNWSPSSSTGRLTREVADLTVGVGDACFF